MSLRKHNAWQITSKQLSSHCMF